MHLLRPPASPIRFRPALASLVLSAATSLIPSAHAFNFGDTLYWNGGGGTWDTTHAEWTTDPALATGFGIWDNSVSYYKATFNGPGDVVMLANPIVAQTLIFNADGYTLAGGSLASNANILSITTTTGTTTIAAPISGMFLEKYGAGTLVLSGANTYTATTDVKAGTLVLGGGTIGSSTTDVGQQIRLYDADFRIESDGSATAYSLGIFKGSATISGAGSTLTTGTISLGNAVNVANRTGPGTLTIANGATVTTTGNADIGNDGIATVTVGGAGTVWNVRNLRLGIFTGADGTITQTGGLVNVTNKLYFGQSGAGKGTYRLEGGTLAVGTSSGIQAIATADYLFELAGGTIKVTGANLTSSVRVSLRAETVSTIDTNSLNGTFSGIISGAGSLEKNGAGNLILSGANTFTGDLRINAGTVRATTSDGALGAGRLTLSAGSTLELANNSALNFGRNTTLTGSSTIISDRIANGAAVTHTLGTLSLGAATLSVNRGSFATSGVGGVTFGATTLTGDATFNVGANAKLTLGAIGGAHGFTKAGSGSLTLVGANTHTGITAIEAGVLTLTLGSSLAHTSAIHVGAGATLDVSALSGGLTLSAGQKLGGSGAINGPVTAASGARIAPGSSPGTLTFSGGLTLNTGAILDLELGSQGDLLRVSGGVLTGSATTGGITINLADSGDFVAGTYTLVDFTGATLGSFDLSDFVFGSTVSGYDYALAFSGNTLVLTATAIPEPSTFAVFAGFAAFSGVALRRRRFVNRSPRDERLP